MSRPVQLGSRSFHAAAQAKLYMKTEILWHYNIGGRIDDPEHVEILEDLLSRKDSADDKRGTGISYWFVDETKNYPSPHRIANDARTIAIHRTDGSNVDFGYTRVIDNSGHVDYVKQALSSAVEDVRDQFKFSHFGDDKTAVDYFTLEVIDDHTQAQVVHRDPSWGKLTSDFAESVGGWYAIELNSGDGDGLVGRIIADPDVSAAWRDYYQSHAMLFLARKA